MNRILFACLMLAFSLAPLRAEAGDHETWVVIAATAVGALTGAAIVGDDDAVPGALVGGAVGAAYGLLVTEYDDPPVYHRHVHRHIRYIRYAPCRPCRRAYACEHRFRRHARHEYLEHEAREHGYRFED